MRMNAQPYIVIQYRLKITSESVHHPCVRDVEQQLGRANIVAVRERQTCHSVSTRVRLE